MADHLHFIAQEGEWLEESIEGRRSRNRSTIVVDPVESVGGVLRYDPSQLLVILLRDLVGVPTLLVADRWRDVQILEEGEGGTDRNGVLHGIAPVPDQVGLEQEVLLRADAVGQCTGIAHRHLFVPTLLADPLFPFEGIDTAHGDGHVGEGDRNGGVARHLIDVHRTRDGKGAVGESFGDVHTGSLGVAVDISIVETLRIVPVVTAGREVDTGREREEGVGLRILGVRPLQLEVFRFAIVWQSFVSQFGHQIGGIEAAVVLVSFLVARTCGQSPGTFRVDLSGDGQVHVVAQCKVITSIPQEESTGALVSEGRKQNTGRIGAGEGEDLAEFMLWIFRKMGHSHLGGLLSIINM